MKRSIKKQYSKALIMKTLFTYVIILIVSTSCNKDKLTGELEAFKGQYTWSHTTNRLHALTNKTQTRLASSYTYTAELEFNDKGKLFFYINGEEIHKTGFSIEQQNVNPDGSISLTIRAFKENSKKLDLNDEVRFALIGNDTLYADDFPGASYDENNTGGHYFIRK